MLEHYTMDLLPLALPQPPELEIRDIGDLTVDQFRGIFRMSYAGDAHIVLKTKVQVCLSIISLRV